MEFDDYTNTLLPRFKDNAQHILALVRSDLKIYDDQKAELIKDYMKQKGLIRPDGSNFNTLHFAITPFGMQVLTKYGSWTKYLLALEEEAKRVSEREELELEKVRLEIETLRTEVTRSKWWWMLVAGLVALVVSLLSNNLVFILKLLDFIDQGQ